jgi:hypothetical protein
MTFDNAMEHIPAYKAEVTIHGRQRSDFELPGIRTVVLY